MRRYLQAIGIFVGTAAGAFYVEPLFPLGDWRWLIVMAAGLAVVWLLKRRDPATQPNYPPVAPEAEKPATERKKEWQGVSELFTVFAFMAVPMLFVLFMMAVFVGVHWLVRLVDRM